MRGVAETVDLSKSGKSFRVKVGGAWYGAKKDTGIEQMRGKTLEFKVSSDPKFGDWMEDIQVVEGAPQKAPNGHVGGSGGDRWFMPFVSNITAHAIQGGYCSTPEEVSKWAKAAYDAAQALDAL